MTIGKSSKKNKPPRSPPFLDKANGFYGRLDEIIGDDVQIQDEITDEPKGRPGNVTDPGWTEDDDHGNDFNQGMMDDDGTTLLQRKPSRLSRRWSRRSLRKAKFSPEKESQSNSTENDNKLVPPAETLEVTNSGETDVVHFSVREHADDQILISGKKEIENELENTRNKETTEEKINEASAEAVKRNTLKTYRKAVDRAFRRGWETFITNLYSVTLTPISSTSLPSSPVKSKVDRNCVLAEFR